MKIDIKSDGSIIGYVVDEIIKVLEETLQDPRVQEYDKKHDLRVQFDQETMAQNLREKLIERSKGHITRNALDDALMQAHEMEFTTPMSAQTAYKEENGKWVVDGVIFMIRPVIIAKDICDNIYNFELVLEMYRWLAKHEVGHFIDHIVHMNGITEQEIFEFNKDLDAEYLRYYKWKDEYRKDPGYNTDTVNRRYYNIPAEARANECAGISVEDIIDVMHNLHDVWKNKTLTLEIKTSNVKDFVKEKIEDGNNKEN